MNCKRMNTVHVLVLLYIQPTINGQIKEPTCISDVCYIDEHLTYNEQLAGKYFSEEQKSVCDGKICGGMTYETLSEGFREMLMSSEKLQELRRLAEAGQPEGSRPESTSSDGSLLQHDHDKCCPTAHLLQMMNTMTNIHGKPMTIIQYDHFKQPVHIGNCVNIPGGCTNCQQVKRLHILLAMDPVTEQVMPDIFYVNSHCACVHM